MSEKPVVGPLLYFLGGAAVGAGLGVLLAPEEETRRSVKEWVRKEAADLAKKKEQVAAAYKAGRQAYAEANGEKVPA